MATHTDDRVLGVIQAYVTFEHVVLFVFAIVFFIVRVLSRRIGFATSGRHRKVLSDGKIFLKKMTTEYSSVYKTRPVRYTMVVNTQTHTIPPINRLHVSLTKW